MSEETRWSDLTTRIISAVSLICLALGAMSFGRLGFGLFVAVVAGLMAWELARLHAPRSAAFSYASGGVMAVLIVVQGALVAFLGLWPALMSTALAAVLLSLGMQRSHPVFVLYWLAIFVTGLLVVFLFNGQLLYLLLLLILVVIATDVFGYFGGRMMGGPKFWPSVSPKKTWSGVLAGWVGAGLVGLGIAIGFGAPLWLAGLAVVMSFAAQLGDIAESAMKRRAGVKDASTLIPGHGGFLDRFDGTIGAAVIVFAALALDAVI